MANLLVVHGGAPTAVMNASLYGVIEQARSSGQIGKVLAAIGGTEAILKERFMDLLTYPETETRKLADDAGVVESEPLALHWSQSIIRKWPRCWKSTTFDTS